jgi:hypothetical protein
MTIGKFVYTPTNPYTLRFRLWSPDDTIPRLARVLGPIGEAIRESKQYCDKAADEGDGEWAQIVVDEETEVIEDLLGTAFVICQTYITIAVSNIMKLHGLFQKLEKRALSGLEHSKSGIMGLGAAPIGTTGYTDIQVIDAFANYFKHREEWHTDWTKLKTALQRKTRDIIVAAGASGRSTGNLRIGAETLGNVQYHQVTAFADRIDSWYRALKNACEARLKGENVL